MKVLFSIILSLAIQSFYFSKTRAETIDIPIGIISADSTIAKHGRQINAVRYYFDTTYDTDLEFDASRKDLVNISPNL